MFDPCELVFDACELVFEFVFNRDWIVGDEEEILEVVGDVVGSEPAELVVPKFVLVSVEIWTVPVGSVVEAEFEAGDVV